MRDMTMIRNGLRLVAEGPQDCRVVLFGRVIAGSDAEPFPILRLADIAVADEFKGSGLSKMLQKDAEHRIKMLNQRRIVELLKEGLRR